MEPAVIERLQAKSVEVAIIDQIGRDFNLAPFMAQTHFEGMKSYLAEYLVGETEVGQLGFLAINADSLPGQPVAACRQILIRLTLDQTEENRRF